MAETYCGKSCETCAQKAQLNCPGCESGPGRQWNGECTLAKCCREKGHETCGTCSFHETCDILRGKGRIAEERLEKRVKEAAQRAKTAEKAPFFGKWLWLLFWLVIPGMLAGIMTNETVLTWAPMLRRPGQLLQLLCGAATILIFFSCRSEEAHYRTAAVSLLASTALSLVMLIPHSEEAVWLLFLFVPVIGLQLFGEYHQFMGHAAVLENADAEQAEAWRRLWKWNVYTYGALLAGLVLLFLSPGLSLLVLLLALIAMVVLSILQLVYLYRAAKLFRTYQA